MSLIPKIVRSWKTVADETELESIAEWVAEKNPPCHNKRTYTLCSPAVIFLNCTIICPSPALSSISITCFRPWESNS